MSMHGLGRKPRYIDESIYKGRHADRKVPRGNQGARCSKCGFICNADRDRSYRDRSKAGEGHDYSSTETVNVGWGKAYWGSSDWGGVKTVVNVGVTGGCPFCGTYLWQKP